MAFNLDELGQVLNSAAGVVGNYRRQSALADLGMKLQSGDYKGAAQSALASGDIHTGLSLLQLGRQDEANAKADSLAGGGVGLSGAVAPSASNGDFLPMFAQAGTRWGVSPGYLSRTAQIESGMDPNAHNRSGADGLMQFVPSTAKQYGLTNAFDPAASIDAGAHLAADNKRVLVASLGREPTDAELYLAHQQGAEGASKLLAHPNAPAVNIVGRQAVIQNGGRPDMTAGEFAGMWLNKFGGAPQQGFTRRVADASGSVPQSSDVGGVDQAYAALDQRRKQIEAALSVEGISPAKERAYKIGLESINRRLTELAPTSAVREYNLAKQQGFTGSFMDFKKASAPGTTINIDQKGETEFAKESNKGIAKKFLDLSNEGDAGQQDMFMLGQLDQLGQVIGTGSSAAITNWLAERGVKLPESLTGKNVGQLEAYTALVDKLTPQQRVPGSGATSDFDARMFRGSLNSLLREPNGNAIITDTLQSLAQNKIDRAAIAEQALAGDLKPADAIKQLRALPNPYEKFKAFQKARQGGGQPAPAPQAQQQKQQLRAPATNELSKARDAISRGADRAEVIKWMRDNNVDSSRL